jgi:hypothetical protein
VPSNLDQRVVRRLCGFRLCDYRGCTAHHITRTISFSRRSQSALHCLPDLFVSRGRAHCHERPSAMIQTCYPSPAKWRRPHKLYYFCPPRPGPKACRAHRPGRRPTPCIHGLAPVSVSPGPRRLCPGQRNVCAECIKPGGPAARLGRHHPRRRSVAR